MKGGRPSGKPKAGRWILMLGFLSLFQEMNIQS